MRVQWSGRMYKSAKACVLIATLASMRLYAQVSETAQPPTTPGEAGSKTNWRQIGNTLIDRSLAGLASGPVDRVWYTADGSQLLIRTASGSVFATSDFETWQPGSAAPPATPPAPPI